jgi:heptosyltransferase-1
MTSILIVRLGAMGDAVHALPAVTALRAALPGAHIGWAIEERWAELLCALAAEPETGCGTRGPAMPLVDSIHFVNTQAWRAAPFSDETWREARGSFRGLRERRYDVALDLQGSLKSATVAALSGAARRAGSRRPWERAAAMFYTHPVEVRSAHVVEQALELASAVAGTHLHYLPPALPLHPTDEKWADELAQRNLGKFAVLCPGAGWGAKQWPAERYGALALALADMGLQVLVNHSPAERALASEVKRTSDGDAQPLQCSVSELTALLRRAKLVVGGDTGPVHLAAALEVPVLALYGPTDPKRTGPFGTRAIVLRSAASATSHARRVETEAGLLEITTEHAIAAARTLLEGSRG